LQCHGMEPRDATRCSAWGAALRVLIRARIRCCAGLRCGPTSPSRLVYPGSGARRAQPSMAVVDAMVRAATDASRRLRTPPGTLQFDAATGKAITAARRPRREKSFPLGQLQAVPRRYWVGLTPVCLRNAAVKELNSWKPSSKAISVTDRAGSPSSALARVMRRIT